MGFNIFSIFNKKKKDLKMVKETMSEVVKNTSEKGSRIDEALKSVSSSVKNSEIQRLQKIQNHTKKQRTKNKLQKRIDSYGK